MIKTDTKLHKIGKIILRNSMLSSPKVASMVLVRVTNETLAEMRERTLMEVYINSFLLTNLIQLITAVVSMKKVYVASAITVIS